MPAGRRSAREGTLCKEPGREAEYLDPETREGIASLSAASGWGWTFFCTSKKDGVAKKNS